MSVTVQFAILFWFDSKRWTMLVTWTDPLCGVCVQFAILFMSMLKPEEQNGARLSILQIHAIVSLQP